MYRISFLIWLALMHTCTFSTVRAQDTADTLKVDLEEIHVTATHSALNAADAPLAFSMFSRDLQSVNHSASLSLSGIARDLPGLWVNDRQNYALGERLTIRGMGWRAAFGIRGIQVVLNGIPLTVADGQTMFNIVDPAFIRYAELIRGPAAVFWGNSSGGVLYLSTTPDLDNEGYKIRLRGLSGSFGLKKGEAEVALSSPHHEMAFYSSYLNTQGFRDYSAARVWRSGITGSVALTSKSRFNYRAASIFMPKAQHPGSLTAEQAQQNPAMAVPSYVAAESGKQSAQGQAALTYILDTGTGILNITGYGIYRDLNNPLPFAIITIDRWAGGIRSTFDQSWNRFSLQVGTSLKWQYDDRVEFENISGRRGPALVNQTERVWNEALFATGTYAIDDVSIMGGLRYDRLLFATDAPSPESSGSRTFQSLSPVLGLAYRPGNHTFFVNLGTSFEAPTTTELVNRPGGGNGFNPLLKPERTLGFELGARGLITPEDVAYDIAIYRTRISDMLFPYQLQANGPIFYRNQGTSFHTGIEAHISANLTNNWAWSFTGNVIRATFSDVQSEEGLSLNGKKVPGIPSYRFNSQLSWTPGPFLGTVSYEFVSSYPVNNLNTFKNEAYHLVDMKVSVQLLSEPRLQPFINLNNIFNVRYNGSVMVNASGGRYYEPAPGINWQAGVSMNF